MKERTANFFWQGPSLSIQEHVCISSFIRHNFIVNVYSYNDKLQIPQGASLKDASEILPYTDLGKYTQAGMPRNLAAFSDAFRYYLLKGNGGWWFDTDVICLVAAENFMELLESKDRKISFGCEAFDTIVSGVLYADDDIFTSEILKRLEQKGTVFEWGDIGPKLFSEVVVSLDLKKYCENRLTYYPIHYNEFHKMYDPKFCEWCDMQINKSYSVHLWNEIRRRNCIPANILPPEGSFLYKKFLEICPELVSHPSLQIDSAIVLIDYSDFKSRYIYYENFEKNVMSNLFFGNFIRLYRLIRNFLRRLTSFFLKSIN